MHLLRKTLASDRVPDLQSSNLAIKITEKSNGQVCSAFVVCLPHWFSAGISVTKLRLLLFVS